jgi:hypothetical protein
MLQHEHGWAIVIDDYANRPEYHVVANFAEIDRYVGSRMAVVTSPKPVSAELLESAIRAYETLPQ